MPDIKTQISTKTATNEQNITTLQLNWGAQGYIVYPVVNGAYGTPIYGNSATADDAMAIGDEVASVKSDGEYEYITVESLIPAVGEAWAVKFIIPCGGSLGGKEVAVEAKEETIATLTAQKAASTSEKEKESLQQQIDDELDAIDQIKNGIPGDTEPGMFALMLACIGLATTVNTTTSEIDTLLSTLNIAESTFSTAMGDLLQDGYYSDETYGPGQEQALYNDSVEMLKILSAPQNTYNLKEIDLANTPGYTDEVFTMNMAVHFYNELLHINDYGFVDQIIEYLDRANTRAVEIKTDIMNIQGKSFSSFLGRITDAAQIVKDKESIFDRAKALSKDGTFGTYKLEGMIDVLKNRLVSTMSNWYTDDNGNIMFVSADESNAMMLSGNGFMVANGKDSQGRWNWRTFGTGEGFTADLITAGVLRASIITILGSDQFFWNDENIYIFDPSDPDGDRQIRIGRYNGTDLGIAYTTDGGLTWQNAIDFTGVHLSASDQSKLNNAGKGGRNYILGSSSITITGSCGTNATWNLNAAGLLDITGSGAMSNPTWDNAKNAIKSVIIHDGITEISDRAFLAYSSLTSVVIPNTVTNLGFAPFYQSGLQHVTLSNAATTIGFLTFGYCNALEEVVIPDGVETLDQQAFGRCANLSRVTIPDSVTSIHQDAFLDCNNLTIICTAGSTADTWAQANNIPVEYIT